MARAAAASVGACWSSRLSWFASGARVELYQHGLKADPALLAAAESALGRMEELLGRKLDETTLGPKVRIYVSVVTTVSHVWRGYEHPGDPRGVLFLNARVARLALNGTNATYAHEMAHLLTWRFNGHTGRARRHGDLPEALRRQRPRERALALVRRGSQAAGAGGCKMIHSSHRLEQIFKGGSA